MKFYKVEMKGEFILEKVAELPTFDNERDYARLLYNEDDNQVYVGDTDRWRILSGIQTVSTLPEFDSSWHIGRVYYAEDDDRLFYGSSEQQDWSNLSGGLNWQVVDSDVTAKRSLGYLCKTSVDTITITLPSDPDPGNMVGVKDVEQSASTNNITIDGNGNNIEGDSQYIIDVDQNGFQLVFVDNTIGWVKVNEVYGYAVYK